jgi:hypothetical protein
MTNATLPVVFAVPQTSIDLMSHHHRQPALDLFGEVQITHDDLFAWVASVSPVHLHERGYEHYLRRYDVAGKVARSKLAGTFDATTARRPPPYHARLALHQIT